MHKIIVAFTVITSLLCAGVVHCAVQEKPLRVAVAANFRPVLQELLRQFNYQTGIQTQLISGATGTLYQQIKHGAPFDVFLAADTSRPRQLQQDGLIVTDSRQTYAIGRLALYHWKNTSFELSDLKDATGRIAIASPLIAPYGRAAKQTLQSLGLWAEYRNRLITGHNISQTFAQVRSKAVASGLIAYSQLKKFKLKGQLIEQRHHQIIAQQLVILKSSQQIENAKHLSEFLRSEPTQQILKKAGYDAIDSSMKADFKQRKGNEL
ncbi:MAG: molybdate ABC transporter substrate-binding protein [Psychrobium sp.]|nr:molybdate ABC transporter substrate-binding protein [Psychrobium sp.]